MYFETVEPKKGSQVLEKSIQSAQSAQSARSARSAVCILQSAWSAFWGDPFSTTSFFIIFYEQRFYEQKPTGVTCKAHCCCVHTKIM